MRVTVVSTYPPRACGIGIFSRDLRAALRLVDPTGSVDVVPIVREHGRHDEPEIVAVVNQDLRSDYVAVARVLDATDTDVVLVEHEYGIFGGEAGAYVLSLVEHHDPPPRVKLQTRQYPPARRHAH